MNVYELYEILLSEKPSIIIKERENEIFSLIPELKKCKGFDQKNEWHIYDVYGHILHVIDNTPTDLVLRVSALFHDVGKPNTFSIDENGIGHFYGHYIESKKIFDEFAEKYGIENNKKILISNLIYYHDKNISKLDNEEVNNLYDIFGIDGIKKLFILKRADLIAQNEKYHYLLDEYDKQERKILHLK